MNTRSPSPVLSKWFDIGLIALTVVAITVNALAVSAAPTPQVDIAPDRQGVDVKVGTASVRIHIFPNPSGGGGCQANVDWFQPATSMSAPSTGWLRSEKPCSTALLELIPQIVRIFMEQAELDADLFRAFVTLIVTLHENGFW